MSSRKTTLFYAVLIAVASLAVGMVIASRLDLSPRSEAATMAPQVGASAPVTGAARRPDVPHDREGRRRRRSSTSGRSRSGKAQDLSDFFGGRTIRSAASSACRSSAAGSRARRSTQAAGTGFIISKDGYILTNNHVVEGATKIEVAFFGDEDGEVYQAKIVGRDQLTDSALHQADRDAASTRCRKPSWATRRRWRRATG